MEVTATIVGEANPVKIVNVVQNGGKIYLTYIDSAGVLKNREVSRGDMGVTQLGTGAVNVP